MPNKKLIISFAGLSAINLAIFYFRDTFAYQPEASYSSLYNPCDSRCMRKWKTFVMDYPAKELDTAKKIMKAQIQNQGSSTYANIENIGQFLVNKFHKQEGTPSPALLSATPFQQFEILSSHDSEQLWCGNYAEMFAFFCWSQNIACRIIEIINEGDHHVLNECYCPETNQWVMVDLTHNQLLIKNSDNRFLNLIDFRNALKQGKTLFALRASRDSVAGHPLNPDTGYIENYYKKESPLLYYHEVDLNKVYSGNAKIKRYFFPVSWYEMYSGHPSFELLFYVKQLFILLWLAVCLRYVLQFFKK